MGLFDFLKKKSAEPELPPTVLLMAQLEYKIRALGYPVERNTQYLAITVNEHLEIAGAIIDTPGAHPLLAQVMLISIHKEYFPQGIKTHLAGIGETRNDQAESAADNYLKSIFPALIESLGEQHSGVDFQSHTDGREMLWHPNMGSLIFQGQWTNAEAYEHETLLNLLKNGIKSQLPNQKLNWLQLFMARQADGEITVECLLNNEPWENGALILHRYVEQWPKTSAYQSQKQFMVFRRCDAFD